MKKLMASAFFRMFLFSVFAVSSLLAYFYWFQYVPSEQQLIRVNLYDRVKTIFNLSGGILQKAIQTNDDITVLSQVESIMKIEDINTVYIIDNSLKVLTHDKTSEWGKAYSDEVSKKAAEAKKILRQNVAGGFLFSMPLASSATLCVGVSSQKLNESLASLNKQAALTALIIFTLAVAAFAGFIYLLVYVRFSKLEEGLKSLDLGGGGLLPEDPVNDEAGRLQKLINSVVSKSAGGGAAGNAGDGAKSLTTLIGALADLNASGVIVIDGNNKVVSINRKAGELLGVGAQVAVGKHVLETFKTPELLALIKKASEKPGETAVGVVSGKQARAMSVPGAGIIIEIS